MLLKYGNAPPRSEHDVEGVEGASSDSGLEMNDSDHSTAALACVNFSGSTSMSSTNGTVVF